MLSKLSSWFLWMELQIDILRNPISPGPSSHPKWPMRWRKALNLGYKLSTQPQNELPRVLKNVKHFKTLFSQAVKELLIRSQRQSQKTISSTVGWPQWEKGFEFKKHNQKGYLIWWLCYCTMHLTTVKICMSREKRKRGPRQTKVTLLTPLTPMLVKTNHCQKRGQCNS